MTIFQALFLGVIQGLTEFLPVSSSGHLVLVAKLSFWSEQPLAFDTTLHLATALALVVYFWADLFEVVKSFLTDLFSKGFNFKEYQKPSWLFFYILIGSIPAGVLGFLFESEFEQKFRSVFSVAIFMLLGTILMWGAQKFSKVSGGVENMTWGKSFFVGIFQALALFPGVSRSGASISGGMFFGLSRADAARFSFLLSIPIVLLAGVFKLVETDWVNSGVGISAIFAGFVSSFLVGLAVVHFLLNYLKTRNLNIFIWYRIVLVAVLLMFFVK